MRKKLLFFLVIFLALPSCFFSSFAGESLQLKEGKFLLKQNGELVFGNDSFLLTDSSWRTLENPFKESGWKKEPLNEGYRNQIENSALSLSREVRKTDSGRWSIQYEYRVPATSDLRFLLIYLDLPAGVLTGPPSVRDERGSEKLVTAPLPFSSMDISLHGSDWNIVDERNAQWPRFRLQCRVRIPARRMQHGKISLSVSFLPRLHKAFQMIPLQDAANRTLQDDDTHSGWLGQGPENDLSNLPKGILYSAAIPFQIGTKAVILKSRNTPAMPLSSGMIPIGGGRFDALYLLQTTAWNHSGEIAKYILHYKDGSKVLVPVVYGRNVLDWWMAKPPVEASIGWKGRNSSSEIALARWRIPVDPKRELAGLELVSLDTSCPPVLIAATALNSALMTGQEKAALAKSENAKMGELLDVSKWFACPISWRKTIQGGSALDLSFLNHKPAGKFGFLRRNGENFEFEKNPGKAVRFWGTNVAIYGCFPEKNLAPEIASNFASQGVNLVRLHFPANRNELLFNSRGEFNAEMLDRFEFFCAELYKQGIYVYMDLNDKLFYDVYLKKAWHWPQPPPFSALFDPEVAEAVREYARRLFTRINPYTGRSIVNEPGIALFQIINEKTMLKSGEIRMLSERHRKKLDARWRSFLKARKLPESSCPLELNDSAQGRRFAFEIYRAHLTEMHAFLRTLGVRVPICGSSKPFGAGDAVASSGMDFQSSHSYYDDPRGTISPSAKNPTNWWNRSPLAEPLWGSAGMMSNLGQVALKGSPMVLGEWNYCYPNFYRAEGIPLLVSLASYQSVDALVFFGASATGFLGKWDRFLKNPAIYIHSQQTDPATWGQSQMAALLFRRGDVRPAERKLVASVPEKVLVENGVNLMERIPFLPALGEYRITTGECNWLGELVLKSASGEKVYHKILNRLKDRRSNSRRIVSDTGEIRRYSSPMILLIDTPRVQVISGEVADLRKTGDSTTDLSVNTAMKHVTISMISLDGSVLRDSRRILMTAVANAANRSVQADFVKGEIYDLGKAPVVAEPLSMKIEFICSRRMKIYQLHSGTGERQMELPAEYQNGKLRFQLTPANHSIYYELADPIPQP